MLEAGVEGGPWGGRDVESGSAMLLINDLRLCPTPDNDEATWGLQMDRPVV